MTAAAELLSLDEVGERLFRAGFNQNNFTGTVFGGQPLAQALAAAKRTVPDWSAHSCTGYFLRRGAIEEPIDYSVEIVRDGRRFAARRVLAIQGQRPIFDMLCSFHDPEAGLAHETGLMEAVPGPDSLPSLGEFVAANVERFPALLAKAYGGDFPIEMRLIDAERRFFGGAGQAERSFWFRMPSAATVENPVDHQCLLAFMSDFWFASVAGAPHWPLIAMPTPTGMPIASLNHSLWFHAPARVDQWLLYRTETPWAGDGRGLARGVIYDLAGKLVASAVQEAALRSG